MASISPNIIATNSYRNVDANTFFVEKQCLMYLQLHKVHKYVHSHKMLHEIFFEGYTTK